MQRLSLLASLLLLPASGLATPFASDVLLGLESRPDGNQAPPFYGARFDGLDGLDGDVTSVWTFDFSHASSSMTLFYDASAGTIEISGFTWGGEDIGGSYAGGGSLWEVHFFYDGVIDVGGVLEVAPGGGNLGTIEHVGSGTVDDLIDTAGSHPYSFRCEDEHRGAGPACYGWVNHSGYDINQHVYSSDWLFVVGSAVAVPEPSAALLFGCGALVFGSRLRRHR